MPKIGTTASLGSRRSTRLESKAPRRKHTVRGSDCVCDECKPGRHRQLRRLGYKRTCDQEHRGADRAIVIVVAGILRRDLARALRDGDAMGAGDRAMRRGADDAIEMHMSERQRNLQRQRRKREPSTAPFMAANPSHRRDANVILLHHARGFIQRASALSNSPTLWRIMSI